MIALTLALLLAAPPQQDADRLSEIAKQLAMEQKYEQAAAIWTKVLAASPNHFPSLFNLGYMNFTQSRFDEGAKFFARAAAVRPADFNAHYLLGSARVQSGHRDDGLRAWRSALALQPDNYKLMQIMAVEYSAGNYFTEACAIAGKAVALKADTPEPYFIAIKACQDASDPAATRLAGDAAARFPQSARANFEHAFQLQKAGRREESVPFLNKAMELDPSYEEPFFFSGRLLLQDEQYAEAATQLRKAIANRPDYVVACVALAKALIETDELDESVTELQKCSALSPTHPQPHLVLSQAYFRLGDEQRARAEKELSLRLRRQHPEIMEAPQARPFPATTDPKRQKGPGRQTNTGTGR